MVISATISTSPTIIYFGQEVGEPGNEDAGFGKPTRTSIFDYIGVPHHQRWMNDGKFDGGQLTESEKELRDFYARLLNFTIKSSAMMGKYQEIQTVNRNETKEYDPGLYSFVRWDNKEKLIIIANCSWVTTSHVDLIVPEDVIEKWNLNDGDYKVTDQLYNHETSTLEVKGGRGIIKVKIKPSESFIFKLQE
jgi:glycosidase